MGKRNITTDKLRVLSGATNGYVLTSDANGNATWQAASGGSSLSGGSAITIGTGNTIDLGGALSNDINYTLISGGGNHILDLGQNASSANLAQLRVYGQSTIIDNLTTYAGGGVGTSTNMNPGGMTVSNNLQPSVGTLQVNTGVLANAINSTTNISTQIAVTDSISQWNYTQTVTGDANVFEMDETGLNLYSVSGGSNELFRIKLDLTGETAQFIDSRDIPVGLEYDRDISSAFTTNSLVTKKYVDDNAGGGGGNAVVNEVKITLTPAQLLALDSTPIQAVAAKAGVAFEVLSAFSRLRYNTTAYNGGAELRIQSATGTRWQFSGPSIDGTQNATGLFVPTQGGDFLQMVENDDLEIITLSPITLGDSEVDVYITYREVTL
jgi:hypothetical protein